MNYGFDAVDLQPDFFHGIGATISDLIQPILMIYMPFNQFYLSKF
jgi:hypothetical protein